jgi:2-oxoglutarate ferredoxin oxidoreductase subunit delta
MATGLIKIDSERCKDCGLCVSVCPRGRIRSSDRINKKGYAAALFTETEEGQRTCTGCSLCAIVCPEVAIEVCRD